MKPILLTNDDGINTPALKILYNEMQDLGPVYVVAPKEDQSASSHSFTLRKPIRIERIKPRWYAVWGTPTDCVLISYHALLNKSIGLIISGINNGPNLGDDVFYSGTVAAAIEGAILGIPAIAVSYLKSGVNTQEGVELIRQLAKLLLKNGLPSKTLLNINIPDGQINGIKITRLGKRIYRDMAIPSLLKTQNSKLKTQKTTIHYTIDGDLGFEPKKGTDFSAVYSGYFSITPLHLDMTHYQELNKLRKLLADLKFTK